MPLSPVTRTVLLNSATRRIVSLPGDITLINDLGSMNGTFVNNTQVQEHTLKDQDRVGVGMYELK